MLNINQRKGIIRAFDKAAKYYDKHAFLQQEIGERLLERLEFLKFKPKTILDLGSGTGYFTHKLQAYFPKAKCVALDIAYGMLEVSRRNKNNGITKYICGDAECLPFKEGSFDLIFANCSLQWSQNHSGLYAGLHKILTDRGLLIFSSFGPDTLMELRQSFQKIDEENHVNKFLDMHHLGDALLRAGFYSPVVDREAIILNYKEIRDLLRDLKGMGANYVIRKEEKESESKINYLNKCGLKQLFAAYEEFRRNELYPATFEVIYGYALKSSDQQ